MNSTEQVRALHRTTVCDRLGHELATDDVSRTVFDAHGLRISLYNHAPHSPEVVHLTSTVCLAAESLAEVGLTVDRLARLVAVRCPAKVTAADDHSRLRLSSFMVLGPPRLVPDHAVLASAVAAGVDLLVQAAAETHTVLVLQGVELASGEGS